MEKVTRRDWEGEALSGFREDFLGWRTESRQAKRECSLGMRRMVKSPETNLPIYPRPPTSGGADVGDPDVGE